MITVQEPRTVMEPVAIQVPMQHTVQAVQVHQKIVEYERPRMIPGKLIRTVAGPTQTIGVTQAAAAPVTTTVPAYGYATGAAYTTGAYPVTYGMPTMMGMGMPGQPTSASVGPNGQITNV